MKPWLKLFITISAILIITVPQLFSMSKEKLPTMLGMMFCGIIIIVLVRVIQDRDDVIENLLTHQKNLSKWLADATVRKEITDEEPPSWTGHH